MAKDQDKGAKAHADRIGRDKAARLGHGHAHARGDARDDAHDQKLREAHGKRAAGQRDKTLIQRCSPVAKSQVVCVPREYSAGRGGGLAGRVGMRVRGGRARGRARARNSPHVSTSRENVRANWGLSVPPRGLLGAVKFAQAIYLRFYKASLPRRASRGAKSTDNPQFPRNTTAQSTDNPQFPRNTTAQSTDNLQILRILQSNEVPATP